MQPPVEVSEPGAVFPGVRHLPDRDFSDEFLALRRAALDWIDPYYHREHLIRAADWLLALDPDAPEHLVIAALLHDQERCVPGGPVLDMTTTRWDDEAYNRAHCDRSAEIVSGWLRDRGASERFVSGVVVPIQQHEFGGSPEGDLAQAADSLSFLEVNTRLVVSWVQRGMCDVAKAKEKLAFMYDRIRHETARAVARPWYDRAVADLDRALAGDTSPSWPPNQSMLAEPLDRSGHSRTVEVNGVRLHYLVYGDEANPAIVVLPGITSPAITWEFIAQPLACDHHVIVMDVRGRGLSDKPRSSFTMEEYAEDLSEFLTALGLERPVVLGHSMGARAAAAFGVLHSRRRGALILADPPLTGPGRAPYATPWSAFAESMAIARAGATAEDMRPFFPRWSDEALALRAAWLPTCDELAVSESYRMLHEEDFFAYWRQLAAPTLLLYGTESPAVPASGLPELADENPAAVIKGIDGAGHMIPWDNLDDFIDEVRRFVARVAPQGASPLRRPAA